MSQIDMRVDTANKLSRLARDLREAGHKELRKKLLKELRSAGKPVVKDVRAAVAATPSAGVRGGRTAHQGGAGLRATIAKATGMSISTSGNASIRIRVNNKRVEPATLPKYLDGELSRFSSWRHKTFGKDEFKDGRSAWFPQSSHPYFFTTVKGHRDDFRKACIEAINDTIEELG